MGTLRGRECAFSSPSLLTGHLPTRLTVVTPLSETLTHPKDPREYCTSLTKSMNLDGTGKQLLLFTLQLKKEGSVSIIWMGD